jgi:hypothetical protein
MSVPVYVIVRTVLLSLVSVLYNQQGFQQEQDMRFYIQKNSLFLRRRRRNSFHAFMISDELVSIYKGLLVFL